MKIPAEPTWKAVGIVWAVAVALIVLCPLLLSCASRPCESPAQSWSDYVRDHPCRSALDPAVAHPGWPGRSSACGAGKCE